MHREPSYPFRKLIKDRITFISSGLCSVAAILIFNTRARKLRGLLVRGLEPRLRVNRSEPARRSNKVTRSLYYFR